MKTNTTPTNKNESRRMWVPPTGWFKAACIARDVERIYQNLIDDNNRRSERGLPTFEPSHDLAYSIAKKSYK